MDAKKEKFFEHATLSTANLVEVNRFYLECNDLLFF